MELPVMVGSSSSHRLFGMGTEDVRMKDALDIAQEVPISYRKG
ncbi:hypothetical protein [Salicibibacter halophilus]|nr:hypothetical protein [Salicibibacter halophilus]